MEQEKAEMLNSPATGSVKEMLQMDIGLKQELGKMLATHARKQSIILLLVSFCTVIVIILFMFYLSRPNPIDRMVFEAIQKERIQVRNEREAIRVERDSIKVERLKLKAAK